MEGIRPFPMDPSLFVPIVYWDYVCSGFAAFSLNTEKRTFSVWWAMNRILYS